MIVAVTATDLPPMTMGEFRSTVTQQVNALINTRSKRGNNVDLSGVRLVSDATYFHLEVDSVDPVGALSDMSPGSFRARCITALNVLISALPFNLGKLDLTGIRLSYYVNQSLLIETGVAPA